MVRPSELRIGSIVYLDDKKGPYTISGGHDIEEIDDNHDNYCNGVPLTEEWLLKFGFEKVEPFGYQEPEESEFIIDFHDGDRLRIKIYTDDRKPYGVLQGLVCVPVAHVHTLQNLYFALTGEELTIKQ